MEQNPEKTAATGPSRILRVLLLVAGAWYLLAFLLVAVTRLPYPYELEWMEGNALAHMQRILAGQPLYHEPALSHLPNMYTPLYYYLSALVAAITGPTFLPLRLVSFASALGILALLFVIVLRETKDRTAAAVSACTFAATYQLGDAWLDVGRVDSLFLLLMLGSVYFIRFGKGSRAIALAGVLAGLAFLTKQTAAVVGLPMGLYLLLSDWRRGLWYCVGVGGVVGITTAVLQVTTGGWFLYYITLAGDHPWRLRFLIDFWTKDLLGPLPFACLASAAALILWRPRGASFRHIYLVAGVGFLCGSWYTRILPLGHYNVLIPAFLWISLMVGIGLHQILSRVRGTGEARLWRLLVLGAALAQLAILIYDPRPKLPTDADEAAGDKLVQKIRSIKGPVFIPCHDYLTVRAGKPGHAQLIPIWESFASKPSAGRKKLLDDTQQLLARHYFSAVILNQNPIGVFLRRVIERYYEPRGLVFSPKSKSFFPVTGMRTRPSVLYLPRRRPARAPRRVKPAP